MEFCFLFIRKITKILGIAKIAIFSILLQYLFAIFAILLKYTFAIFAILLQYLALWIARFGNPNPNRLQIKICNPNRLHIKICNPNRLQKLQSNLNRLHPTTDSIDKILFDEKTVYYWKNQHSFLHIN